MKSINPAAVAFYFDHFLLSLAIDN